MRASRILLAATLCLCAAAPPAPAAPRSSRAPFVPANFSPITDSAGFVWNVDSNGALSAGNGLFNSSFYLEVNGSSYSIQSSMMSPDGSEYLLTGNANNVTFSRRILVDRKNSFIRYIDSFTNTAPAQQSLSISLRVQFNNQMQSVLTDSGAILAGALGRKDSGFVVGSPQQPTSVLFMLGSPGAKMRPTVSNQNNYRFQITYPLAIGPGETISLLYAAAQRNLAGALDAKSLAKAFAPLKSPRLVADLPLAERKSLANFKAGALVENAAYPVVASLLDALNVERGTQDVLAIGAETRLKGTASCASLTITTPRGRAEVPFENVAAVIGGPREGRVLLRDGQALSGVLAAKGFRFTLTTGTTIDLDISALDRLVLRERPEEKTAVHAAWGLLDTFEGDRLAVNPARDLRLRATTAWGACEVPLEDLIAYGPTAENPLAFTLVLKDGSRFVALLDGGEIPFETVLFGRKTFRTSEIRQVSVSQSPTAENADSADQEAAPRAQVTLAGNQIISGQVDLPELHFLSPAGVIPVTPNLLHRLTNTSEDSEMPAFTAEIWGGGGVSGTLRELMLPVRSGATVFQVPVRDILAAVVPSPVLPEGLRDKIAALIRDLGHPDWEKRESASRELGGLGAMTRDQLQEAVKQTSDAEVRRRVQALLDELETL